MFLRLLKIHKKFFLLPYLGTLVYGFNYFTWKFWTST